jgi:hypothetical protein
MYGLQNVVMTEVAEETRKTGRKSKRDERVSQMSEY